MILAKRTTENMGSTRVERGIVEDALCHPRGSSSDFLPGAERHKRAVLVPCYWRRPAVATNGGGSHFLPQPGRRVITGLGVLHGVEPHFLPSPTKA